MTDLSAIHVIMLLPVYNEQVEMDASLEAIQKSSLLPDILIVDDGSIPAITIADRYNRLAITLLRNERNRGIEYSLNKGVSYILNTNRYRYIARLDAGDTITPDRLEKQYNFLLNKPDCYMVGSFVEHRDEANHVLFIEKCAVEYNQILKNMHYNSAFAHPAVMIRAEAFEKVGLYSDQFPAAEDYEFFYRLAQNSKVCNIGEVLTIKKLHRHSISIRKRRLQLKSRIHIQVKYFDFKSIHSYLGLFFSFIVFITPTKMIQKIKCLLLPKQLR